MNTFDRQLVIQAAERYKVKLPGYVFDAQTLLDAATTYKAQVAGLEQPQLDDVTPTTIGEVVDRVLAFGQRDERLRLACKVEAIAANALDFAVMRLSSVLMTALAAPFDTVAQQFMDAYDTQQRQNPAVVATLADLIQVRDLLATGKIGDGLPGVAFDIPTRTATFPDRHAVLNRYRLRTAGKDRGTEAWFTSLLSISGVRLKWQTPEQQREHVHNLPAGDDALAKFAGGDAA